jgi:hypothetical protein
MGFEQGREKRDFLSDLGPQVFVIDVGGGSGPKTFEISG